MSGKNRKRGGKKAPSSASAVSAPDSPQPAAAPAPAPDSRQPTAGSACPNCPAPSAAAVASPSPAPAPAAAHAALSFLASASPSATLFNNASVPELVSHAIALALANSAAPQPRYEIREFATNKELAAQFSLFIRAFEKLKLVNPNDIHSFQKIGAIHGDPAEVWDPSVNPKPRVPGDIYCQHGVVMGWPTRDTRLPHVGMAFVTRRQTRAGQPTVTRRRISTSHVVPNIGLSACAGPGQYSDTVESEMSFSL